MAIGTVELNGSIQRVQDFAAVKHNEDNKVVSDQSNLQTQFSKNVQENVSRVKRGEDAHNTSQKHDAREKGKNEYHGDGGRRRPGERTITPDGKVIAKSPSGFDMKI